MTYPTVRVVVVDDHPVFRMGLIALINGIDGIDVVAEAPSAEEALVAVGETSPDVVIMDVQLPGGSGIEATAAILRSHPAVGVLVLTMFDDDDSVHAAIAAGARGYLVKGAGPAEIERGIRAVANGEVLLGASAARRAHLYWRSSEVPFPELTERERGVLDLVATGLDNLTIANRLYLNEKTVRNHVSSIFSKLGTSSRAELVAKARDAGMGASR